MLEGLDGATVFQPLSTGITFALTEKAPGDKIPLITAGYGRSESADGGVFKWNFPLAGTYWVAGDVIIQDIAKKVGGADKLKGKHIALVYHDSPFGKEAIPILRTPSLRKRMACWLYEGMLLFGVVFIAGYLFGTLSQTKHAMNNRHGLQAFLFLVFAIYFTWLWSKGQTLAMKTW
ncbi:ABC transporter substrate-binding protein, partial [Limnohabitans sp. Rim11]|uniref:ABC transporter substrate-binding protein n=1 Tax=Limnohabitans sp. Rim11 TaxID=1100719 RepID=UPI001E2A5078